MAQDKDFKKALLAISAFTVTFGVVLLVLFGVLLLIGVSSTGLLRIVCWLMAGIFLIVIMIGLIVCFKRLNVIRKQIVLNNINENMKNLGFTINEIKARQKDLLQQRRSKLKVINRNLNRYKEGKIKQSDISENEFYKPLTRNSNQKGNE
ncbi:hypothetical protein PZN54_11190 [Staphylococcus capitis]|uniref:hypothetical protein n=1 Tax=Staphylococcus capitis TaxID=29388 RepID=UPI0024802B94|nr:hypothetical protein [Staphylococcus capitis]MDH9600723.1 hypothetical protein [Staphylococcus capitis]MDH9624363.1 hypothetical protein [Staphylococcus capitis]